MPRVSQPAVCAAYPLVRSFLLSLRMDGLRSTIRRGWARLFGSEEWYVFVRHLAAPAAAVPFAAETAQVTLRPMVEGDLEEVARLLPFDLDRRPAPQRIERIRNGLSEAVVATRAGRIVGAVWFADTVNHQQPWYEAIRSHLTLPTRLTVNVFVVPGQKAAAWAMMKHGNERLAAAGVRSVVGLIQASNKAAILMSRMLGSKMVARQSVRYWFGHRTTAVEPMTE
jgi:hypothetical protein